ncbi:MAG: hypothetical protein ACREQX_08330, partial [Candidatus Binataceae bacterium]
LTGNDTVTLSPGTYEGGIQIGNNVRSVTFNPGTYIIDGGGISVPGGATLSGSGVTFFLAGGAAYAPVILSGNSRVNLSAPVSGPFKGILFFQDRSVAAGDSADDSVISGDAGSTFDGALYFPTTGLTYAGDSSAGGYTFLIADRITVMRNAKLGNDYSSLQDGPPIKSTALYE